MSVANTLRQKSMSRFFIPAKSIKGKIALISGQEAHHILDVMRLKDGDSITAFDGQGLLYQGRIIDTSHKQVKLQIESILKDKRKLKAKIALVQALPKKHKMDYIIEKATELGVDSIIPVETTRTIIKLDAQKKLRRHERWQRIAKEASKQCARLTIPEIKEICSWPDALASLSNFNLKLLFCLTKETRPIKKVLAGCKKAKNIALCIGPEGDFTQKEIKAGYQAGCVGASLGTNVLKVDTAALSALSMITYELN